MALAIIFEKVEISEREKNYGQVCLNGFESMLIFMSEGKSQRLRAEQKVKSVRFLPQMMSATKT